MTRVMTLVLGAFAVSLTSCSTMQSTPQQEYVWAMWAECKVTDELRSSPLSINRVDPDGQYWSNATTGPAETEWPRVEACMNEQFKRHPYSDWLKTRQASAPQPTGSVGTIPSPASTPRVARDAYRPAQTTVSRAQPVVSTCSSTLQVKRFANLNERRTATTFRRKTLGLR
jgi:hypothetical protein